MAKHTYLVNRHGNYFFRIRVPKQLQEPIGRKEIWKQLPRVYTSAIHECKIHSYTINKSFRYMIENYNKLNFQHIKLLGERHHSFFMAFDEYARTIAGEQNIQEHESEITYLRHQLKNQNYGLRQNDIISCLKANEITFDVDSPQDQHHLQFASITAINAEIKYHEEAIKRNNGQWSDEIYSKKLELVNEQLKNLTAPITLGQLIDEFNNAKETKSKTIYVREKYKQYQLYILELIGAEITLDKIDRKICRSYLNKLDLIPKHARKKFPGISLTKIIEITKERDIPRFAPSTLNDYMEHLALILTWARKEGYKTEDYTVDLRVKEHIKDKDKRDPFHIDELNLIFSDEQILKYKNDKKLIHRFWIPTLSLLSGMRLGEICQLTLADIKTEHGITYISVNVNDEKTVKTESSIRQVPVSKLLQQLGFIEYINQLDYTNSEARLFPDLVVSKKRASDAFSKHFSQFLKDIDIKRKQIVFHSFRHNYRDFVRNSKAGVAALVIGGWMEGNSVHNTYGKGFSLEELYNDMNKIKFKGIKFLEVLN